jgi:hypothetical protein
MDWKNDMREMSTLLKTAAMFQSRLEKSTDPNQRANLQKTLDHVKQSIDALAKRKVEKNATD